MSPLKNGPELEQVSHSCLLYTSGHLLEISEALLQVESDDATRVMGFPDDMKLQSCIDVYKRQGQRKRNRGKSSGLDLCA